MRLSKLILLLESDLSPFRSLRTKAAYLAALRSVTAFLGFDPELGEIFDPDRLSDYQAYLIRRGLKRNTISFYMRMLRTICNKAVGMGLYVSIPGLFFKTFTGLAPTVKRSVAPHVIRTIARARLTGTLEFCRDMFMLCFYLQGMAFVDLAFLKKSDVQGDYLTYCRRKTGSSITVHVNDGARRILKKYAHLVEGSEYLFPIITDSQKDAVLQYQSALHAQNLNLKKLAKVLGLDIRLTTYVARHSWATMAYSSGVPVARISQAMGHKTESMTRIYLASLDLNGLKEAGDTVVRALELDENSPEMQKKERVEKGGNKTVRHLTSDGQKSDANI